MKYKNIYLIGFVSLACTLLLYSNSFASGFDLQAVAKCTPAMDMTSAVPLIDENTQGIATVLAKFHCGLSSGNTKKVVESYYTGKDETPYLLTNVPTDLFEKQVWPCHADASGLTSDQKKSALLGRPISGITELTNYQRTVFKFVKFNKVVDKILKMNVGQQLASVISYGSHYVTLTIKGKIIHKVVQDTELDVLKKNKEGYWKILTVAFIDKNRDSSICEKTS